MKVYSNIKLVFLFILTLSYITGNTQNDSTLKKRKQFLIAASSVLWAGSAAGLYSLWYKDYPSSRFHSFDDKDEWLQIDKAGHFVTANITASLGYEVFRWAGYREDKAIWVGGGLGWIFLSTIEIMDGFYKRWGFSWTDMAANTAGSLAFMIQQKQWKEQRIILKVSYHASSYSVYRPDLLGRQWYEQIIKDYNGQTYWMSFNPGSFFQKTKYLPSWLNLSLGYSANGMMGGRINPIDYQGISLPVVDRYRRYFFSPDICLSRLPVKNKTLKTVFKALGFIKVPLPTLEYNKEKGFMFHLLYF